MYIQDLDLDIKYCSDKDKVNVAPLCQNQCIGSVFKYNQEQEALSIELSFEPSENNTGDPLNNLTNAIEETAQQKLQEIRIFQQQDAELKTLILYLEKDQLPEDETIAKKNLPLPAYKPNIN